MKDNDTLILEKRYTMKVANKPICRTRSNGDKYCWLNGKLHREDGPAIEYANGNKEWWLDGKRHRKGGPAVELAGGGRSWWLNDKLHRENGPAVEHANGIKEWYLNGKEYSEQDYKLELIRRGILKNPSLSNVMDAI